MPGAALPEPSERQVAPVLVHALLRYVRRVAGPDVVDEVVRRSPLPRDELFNDRRWFSSTEAIAIADAAAQVCHDEHIGVRAGIELWWMLCEKDGYVDLVRSTGDVGAAIAASAQRGSKLSTGRRNVVEEIGADHVILTGHYGDPATADRFYCGLSAGFYAQVPRAFGMVGDAAEVLCQLDGAGCCTYRITWQPDPNALAPDTASLAASADRVQQQIDQLEEVHQLTSQLLSADGVDEVLARVTAEAGRAVQAPRYLLAVRINDRDRLRVHQRGFRAGTADTFAERLLAGEVGESDGVLCADVAHDDRYHGRLAACYSRGSNFADNDRRLLRAYARHAAAVLDHVASLEQAATDRDTARALLDLARSIAGASSVAEVARRLVDTVPRVVDCDVAALWTWDEETDELVLSAYADGVAHTGFAGPARLAADELEDIRSLADAPSPLILDADTAAEPVRGMLTSSGLSQVAVVPVTLHGRFAGIVCAGYRRELPEEQTLFGRLAGLADHAAVALQSVRLVERISHQALHDNLTGLANRQKLQEHGELALARARRTKRRVALLFIDLDRFKNVNDTLGHAAGDELIKQVAQRITDTTRPTDVLARLGGDEFLLMLPDVADNDAAVAAAQRIVDTLQGPFVIGGRQAVYISCSIGVACYPDHGADYPSLVKHADIAMYTAKAEGRNQVALYTDRRAAPRPASIELEGQLHAAIERDEIEVFFQPQYDLAGGVVAGAEALVRWRHPTYGLLEPISFIGLAEESGLISAIDARVREVAFARTKAWHDEGHPIRIAVNLDGTDLRNPRFPARVIADVAASGLSPEFVEVEITDRVVIDDDTLRLALEEFHAAGLRVAIDDFGTGSSVLGRLHKCRVQTLKIDRGLIQDIQDNSQSGLIVEAVLALARNMGLTTVVEGIENVHQLEALRTYGADLGQGFLLSRPVAAETFATLLTTTTSVTASLLRATPTAAVPRPRLAPRAAQA